MCKDGEDPHLFTGRRELQPKRDGRWSEEKRLKGTRESVNHGWGGEGAVSNNIMVGKIRNGEAAGIGGSPSFQ